MSDEEWKMPRHGILGRREKLGDVYLFTRLNYDRLRAEMPDRPDWGHALREFKRLGFKGRHGRPLTRAGVRMAVTRAMQAEADARVHPERVDMAVQMRREQEAARRAAPPVSAPPKPASVPPRRVEPVEEQKPVDAPKPAPVTGPRAAEKAKVTAEEKRPASIWQTMIGRKEGR